MLKFTVSALAFAAVLVFLTFAVRIGIDREIARQDAVRAYNCQHYGAAINQFAGEEVCPPTPQG